MDDRIRLGSVALDCPDPRGLADFYSGMTGWPVQFATDDFAAVAVAGKVGLTMHRVAGHEPPTWPQGATPKQLHLDFAVRDLPATERRATALGARRAEHQPAADRFLVLLDPAGHPFCLTTQFPEELFPQD